MKWLQYILIAIAGVSKAIMDTLQFHFSKSGFPRNNFWNPEQSWKNKYTDPIKLIRKKWFGLINVPVLLTDGFHFFQSIFLTCMFAAIVFYQPLQLFGNSESLNLILDFLLLRGIFGLSFVVFYKYLLIK